MNEHRRRRNRWINLLLGGLMVLVLVGCGGGGDGGGGSSSSSTSTPTPVPMDGLAIAITSVTIASPPVVKFKVTNGAGAGVNSLVAGDLRFNIAKLVPAVNGDPSTWQNYINRANGGAVQGSQERTASGFAFGTLVNHGDGSYTYTFATDITSPTANPCPAPCTDADGKPLDITYAPGLTHRVTIQQANSAYPHASGIYDFIPGGSGNLAARDVVVTSTCNQCHSELTAHGTRVDVKLCVTCHNRGSWVAGTPNTTVDFKVMVHRIHYNIYNSLNATNPNAPNYMPRTLPSVAAGYPYKIGNADFSDPTFTQDVRNCSVCHDGARSAQGDNWKTQPSMGACGSCHDNVYFGLRPDPAKPYQNELHPAGVATDNSTCALCHGPGKVADVSVAHNFPSRFKAAAGKFKLNIISATPTASGSIPVVTFSVTDPTNGDKPYDIKTHPAFTTGGGLATLTVKLAWTTSGRADIGNDNSGQNFGQPISINALSTAAVAGANGTYTVTSPIAIPAGQTGTLRVIMEGHPAGDVSSTGPTSDDITLPPGTFADRLSVKSVFRDFAVAGTVTARRTVVDINKCNVCHDVLSLHGNNRTDEPQVCAVCHNPNATDAAQRPKAGGALAGGVDGKPEEAIDFKTMVHAIHAGQKSNGGFREKGIVVYGFGGSVNDYSKVVFPGKLGDCGFCHVGTTYQLSGIWNAPTGSGILSTTVSTATSASDPMDNLRNSPTAAVCSSCHDSSVAKIHMQDPSSGGTFSALQSTIDGTVEGCILCHGPGRVFDVKVVHGAR